MRYKYLLVCNILLSIKDNRKTVHCRFLNETFLIVRTIYFVKKCLSTPIWSAGESSISSMQVR